MLILSAGAGSQGVKPVFFGRLSPFLVFCADLKCRGGQSRRSNRGPRGDGRSASFGSEQSGAWHQSRAERECPFVLLSPVSRLFVDSCRVVCCSLMMLARVCTIGEDDLCLTLSDSELWSWCCSFATCASCFFRRNGSIAVYNKGVRRCLRSALLADLSFA